MSDYIKREDAIKAMAQYMMDMALIDNPEASDRIEQWEGSIAAPVMSTVKAADVVEVVRCNECIHNVGIRDNTEFYDNDIVCDYWESDGLYSTDFCSYGKRAEA